MIYTTGYRLVALLHVDRYIVRDREGYFSFRHPSLCQAIAAGDYFPS